MRLCVFRISDAGREFRSWDLHTHYEWRWKALSTSEMNVDHVEIISHRTSGCRMVKGGLWNALMELKDTHWSNNLLKTDRQATLELRLELVAVNKLPGAAFVRFKSLWVVFGWTVPQVVTSLTSFHCQIRSLFYHLPSWPLNELKILNFE